VSSIDKKYKAVIFDLYGTLVYNFSRQEYESVLAEMAEILAIQYDELVQLWFGSFKERTTGVLPSPRATIEQIYRKLKIPFDNDRIEKAAQVRLDYTIRAMKPIPGSIEVLTRLKSDNYKIGLISDCSAETPVAWENSPFAPLFDVTVFSCIAGIKKPSPRIYQIALDQLAIQPEECLYIGDGSSHELTGAKEVGLYPVLIRHPDESIDAHYIDREEWNGTVISSLWEVLNLIK
jgi:putative hydrolase of the HAD superfamily